MTTPDWLKPGLYGALIGAMFLAAVGFTWGGWVTGVGANRMANAMAHDDVITALVPVCLDRARTDPDRNAQLAKIRAASIFQQRDAVMAAGWATMPGSGVPNRDLAKACMEGLELDAS